MKYQKGFTLIELLTVVTIIVILGSIGSAIFSSANKNAALKKGKAVFALIKTGLEHYRADFGEYPEPANGNVTTGNTDGEQGGDCLYQALTGDGYDRIYYSGTAPATLPGQNDTSAGPNGTLARFGPSYIEGINKGETDDYSMISSPGSNRYTFVDPYQEPVKYQSGGSVTPPSGSPPEHNVSSFDMWMTMNQEIGRAHV